MPESADPIEYCTPVDRSVARSECRNVADAIGRLKTVDAGWSPIKQMYVGETTSLRFAISRDAQVPVEVFLGEKPVEELKTRASGTMSAKLTGVNFTIDPPTAQTLPLTMGGASWSWDITARPGKEHRVEVTLYAILPDTAGQQAAQLVRVFRKTIPVKVKPEDWFTQKVTALTKGIGELSGLMQALLVLIPLAGAVWLAIRRFGRPAGQPPR